MIISITIIDFYLRFRLSRQNLIARTMCTMPDISYCSSHALMNSFNKCINKQF